MGQINLGKIITEWLSGSSDPGLAIGANGDCYLNTTTGDVFKKSASGSWVKTGNIKGAVGAQGNTGATGPQGPKGDTGATGAQGSQGNTGAAGATWLSGTSNPATGNGVNGDFYLNTTTWDVYKKTSGAWASTGNIKGATGSQGSTGAAGAAGATWLSGTSNPASSTGANGDFFLNTTTWDVFKKTSGTWASTGNIKGATGATGATGPQGPAGAGGLPVYITSGTSSEYTITDSSFDATKRGNAFIMEVHVTSAAAPYLTFNGQRSIMHMPNGHALAANALGTIRPFLVVRGSNNWLTYAMPPASSSQAGIMTLHNSPTWNETSGAPTPAAVRNYVSKWAGGAWEEVATATDSQFWLSDLEGGGVYKIEPFAPGGYYSYIFSAKLTLQGNEYDLPTGVSFVVNPFGGVITAYCTESQVGSTVEYRTLNYYTGGYDTIDIIGTATLYKAKGG